jgi:DNA-binding NarL/FixJ family response regulator
MGTTVHIVLADNDPAFESVVQQRLNAFEGTSFEIVCKNSIQDVLEYVQQHTADLLLTDSTLADGSGRDLVTMLQERLVDVPVIFLTDHQDVHLVLDVMRLGVQDYLLKSDVVSYAFPQSLLRIVERHRLKSEISELDVKKQRLEAMQALVLEVSSRIQQPLDEMKTIIAALEEDPLPEKTVKYVKLIHENLDRLVSKLDKLNNLKEDKTVQYIGNIKMLDIS